jgi:hypothetical protein
MYARFFAAVLSALILTLLPAFVTAGAQEKQKDPNEGKKGKTIGTLTEKKDNYIEVRADGEEKPRRYVPQWRGGMPAEGGGLDKKMLKTFKDLKIGSRIEVEWVFEERFRAVNIKLLALPKDKEKTEK